MSHSLAAEAAKFSKPNPFTRFAKPAQAPVATTFDKVPTTEAVLAKSSTRKKRKHAEVEHLAASVEVIPANNSANKYTSPTPPKQKKKHRKDRAESEFSGSSFRPEVSFNRTHSHERAVSSPPVIHRDPQMHNGFLGTSHKISKSSCKLNNYGLVVPNDNPTPRRPFLIPKTPPSSSGVPDCGSSPWIDPALESITLFNSSSSNRKPATAISNYTMPVSSRKIAADRSLRSDDQFKALLKRLAELELVQQEHVDALAHVAELHDDVQELKEKETELRTIVVKLSAGQALSPAESKKVTEESSNTIKV
jgi:hypothetical protein